MTGNITMPAPLSTTKAAEIAGVSPSTVIRWCGRGRFNCGKTPFGDWAIDAESFQMFLDSPAETPAKKPTPWRKTMTVVPEKQHPPVKQPRLTLAEMAALHKAGKLQVISLPMGATELPPKNT